MSSAAHTSPAVIAPRPKWRGLLHLIGAPVAVLTGMALLFIAETAKARTGVAIYALSLTGLFTMSAIYHRGHWRPTVKAWLQRVDHSMIFVLIAGTYTPFCLLVLAGSTSIIVLSIVWGGAAAGIITRLTWHRAPSALFVPIYLAMGWTALVIAPALAARASVAVNEFLVAGGVLYTIGAVVYATKRPNLFPSVFGFHELFHAFTIAAAICHTIAITLILL
jgi:hemolysin III